MTKTSRACAGAFALLCGALYVTSGCQRSPVPGGEPTTSPGSATAGPPITGRVISSGILAPDAGPGLSLDQARLVLPAVSGRPGAVYFTLVNRAATPATLVATSVAGAGEAQMHVTSGGSMTRLRAVQVPANGSVAFAPGRRHVMVFAIPASVHPGGTIELTLTFKGGDKLTAPITVVGPGSGGDTAMSGMKME